MNDLEQAARRLLEAWDSSPLPKSNDGMMQERMEDLRAELAVGDKPASEPVAWRYVPSDAWGDQLVTQDPKTVELAKQFGRDVEPLYTHAIPPGVQRDAERYRYHRSVGGKSWHRVELPGSVLATGDVFDAATDAAMTAPKVTP
jgi:hypothetical protein